MPVADKAAAHVWCLISEGHPVPSALCTSAQLHLLCMVDAQDNAENPRWFRSTEKPESAQPFSSKLKNICGSSSSQRQGPTVKHKRPCCDARSLSHESPPTQGSRQTWPQQAHAATPLLQETGCWHEGTSGRSWQLACKRWARRRWLLRGVGRRGGGASCCHCRASPLRATPSGRPRRCRGRCWTARTRR